MHRAPRQWKPIKLVPGVLQFLVLQALGDRQLSTLGIKKRIFEATRGTFSVSTGSLVPAINKLEEKGYLGVSQLRGKRRTRFFVITLEGRDYSNNERKRWRRVVDALQAACDYPRGEQGRDDDWYRYVPNHGSKHRQRLDAVEL